ncbi:MAG TPA: MFS transporter [Miltoncostaeaceae bacterium]|nr:MFS transporter [Miltoncostaeaceae bacterium]
MRAWADGTFAALRNDNYRRYFAGQAVSLVGTWMQTVAQGWLVLELTGSGTALGLVAAAQFAPLLLLAPYGGVLADRMDKRRLLIATQTALGLIALTLGVLVVAGVVALWMVVALAFALGVTTAVDNPARQAFAQEMVGPSRVRNAVTLNSILVNAARAVGPAVAGILIATAGTGVCFLVNAVSYAAVLAALISMDVAALQPSPRAERARGQVREGLAYVGRTPDLLVPLIMLALVGTLTYEFSVVLPLLARGPFDGGPGTYGLLTSAMGAGAIIGGLVVAGRGATGLRPLTAAAAMFGAAVLVTAAAPTALVAAAALVVVGATSIAFLATGNTTLQLAADPRFRGRVMALWAVAFLGSTPLGAPVIGAVSEHVSPRGGLVVGGVACLTAAAIGLLAQSRGRDRAQPDGITA